MTVWAIADLHLSFGIKDKEMDVFGKEWHNHHAKIEQHWREDITNEDLVLLAGDISWAKRLEEALPDLSWINALPGTKVMIRGNHDYWWSSPSKVRDALPSSLHIIQNDTFEWNDVAIAGSRLWDSTEYNFKDVLYYLTSCDYLDFKPIKISL